MRALENRRVWYAGGGVAAVGMVLAAWLFVIGPQRASAAAARDATYAAQAQTIRLSHRLDAMRTDQANIAQFEAELAADRQALPTTVDTTAYLQQLQAACVASGATLTAMTVAQPLDITTSSGIAAPYGVFAIPVSVTIGGTDRQLGAFLDQVQQHAPRASLVTAVSIKSGAAAGSTATGVGAQSMQLSVQLFVVPADALTRQQLLTEGH